MSTFESLDEAESGAGSLAMRLPAFPIATTCGQAFDFFQKHPDYVAAAVVHIDGSVAGIVNRLRFLARYAKPFVPELYSKKTISKLSNPNPLIVDEAVPVMDLGKLVVLDWPDALRECFIVTRNGKYLGIGTSEALVRAKLHLLTARETQLHHALRDAMDANRAKSNFLALMSHELRTPLNAIIGFSEVLHSELFGPHVIPRYREYSEDINGAGKHLLALINDILDLSKSEAGKLDLFCEQLDLEEMGAECFRLITDRASEQNITLFKDIDADFPLLYADKLRVKQILLNLLSNAVKFTPSGGLVRLSAEITAEGGIVLSVSDTGIGMAPESIPKALEPFRQIDSPLSRKVEGTGLGLSLVKNLAELHGARIFIESVLNVGTRVRISFPALSTIMRSQTLLAITG